MADKKFLMLSLEDEGSKKIANIVGNESCRKILDHLSTKEATESELAKKLNLPLSTVHYNLQQLVKADLVSAEEYHYSKKGKEIRHYKLANRYIIITPKAVSGIKGKLSKILPVALLSAGAAGIVQLVYKYAMPAGKAGTDGAAETMAMAAPQAAGLAAEESMARTADTAMMAQQASPDPVSLLTPFPFEIGLLFFLGCLFGAIVYAILSWMEQKRR